MPTVTTPTQTNMKKTLLAAILLLALAWPVLGQKHTQSLTFDDLGLGGGAADSGTYDQNDTFSFDVYLTFAGYNCFGLSLWLETQTLNNFASSLSITNVTYGKAFPDFIQLTPNPAPFNASTGAPPGYFTENRDLGALTADAFEVKPPGTYLVAHISFAIAGAQPGTYTLRSTTVIPHTSEAGSYDPSNGGTYMDNPLPAEDYTITIVPEPATATLLGLGAVGLAAILRAKRRTPAGAFRLRPGGSRTSTMCPTFAPKTRAFLSGG